MKTSNTDSTLTFEKFSKANCKRCEAADGFNHRVSDWTSAEWLAACIGELGEVAHVVKRMSRQRDNLAQVEYSDEKLKSMLAEEIADTIIYLDMLAHSQEINLGEAIKKKFNQKSEEIGSGIFL